MLTLSEALRTNRIRDFVRQEEERGIGPADRKKLDATIKKLAAILPKSKGRTSRSASRDGSNGK
jgi:hypothetical protein